MLKIIIFFIDSDFQVYKMNILGKDPIDSDQLINQERKHSSGLWPSDHFGLLATVRTRTSLNVSVDSDQLNKSSQPSHSNQDKTNSIRTRPPNPFLAATSLPQLKHVDGIVVTQRDGSRILEKIDRENGNINQESLSSVGVNCISCGKDMGFQLLVQIINFTSFTCY